jgi:hypothetical protein
MPMNTYSKPMVYNIKVTVADAASNIVSSQPLPVTVLGKPQSGLKKPAVLKPSEIKKPTF